jgi:hypothetical protein
MVTPGLLLFDKIADALSIDPRILAIQWADCLGLSSADQDPIKSMVKRAFRQWRQHSHIAERAVGKRKRPKAEKDSPAPMRCWSSSYTIANHNGRLERARHQPKTRSTTDAARCLHLGQERGHCSTS